MDNTKKKRTFIRVTTTSDAYEYCGEKSTYIDASLIYKIVDGRCGSTIFYDDLGNREAICTEETSEEIYKKINDVTDAEDRLMAKEYENKLAEFYNRINRSLL